MSYIVALVWQVNRLRINPLFVHSSYELLYCPCLSKTKICRPRENLAITLGLRLDDEAAAMRMQMKRDK
jgi:hypothetical protein